MARARTRKSTTPPPAPARQPEVSAEEAARIAQRLTGGPAQPRTVAAPKQDTLYFARRPFGYAGVQLDREQIVRVVGAVNDEKLIRLGYIAPVQGKVTFAECNRCPAKFMSKAARDAHGDRRHAPPAPARELDPQQPGESAAEFDMRRKAFELDVETEENQRLEREERELNQQAPLYLDQTEASRNG